MPRTVYTCPHAISYIDPCPVYEMGASLRMTICNCNSTLTRNMLSLAPWRSPVLSELANASELLPVALLLNITTTLNCNAIRSSHRLSHRTITLKRHLRARFLFMTTSSHTGLLNATQNERHKFTRCVCPGKAMVKAHTLTRTLSSGAASPSPSSAGAGRLRALSPRRKMAALSAFWKNVMRSGPS